MQVEVGTTDDVEVPLDTPLTADTDLTATPVADTDVVETGPPAHSAEVV